MPTPRRTSPLHLTDDALRNLAGTPAFDRGVDYARRSRVRLQTATADRLAGIVVGSERYRSMIQASGNDEPTWHCDCPAAIDGDFCKHLVALAIAARGAPASSQPSSEDALRSFLRAQPAERLADWLVELAETHEAVAKRLRLRQAEADPQALRKVLGTSLRGRGFLDWRASTRFAHELDAVLDSLAAVCHAQPDQGSALCEFALRKLFARYTNSDDSSGAIGGRLQTLGEIYRGALERQPPNDPGDGRRFLELQRLDDWNVLGLDRFWPVLGPNVQRSYAAAVEAEYAALDRRPAKRNSPRSPNDFGVVKRMEALATVRGDVDLLVRVLARDLSSGYAYQRIVLACAAAGREREATAWAERGYRAHPRLHGLRELLANRYRHDGLADKALELIWEGFCGEPSAESWQRLQAHAAAQWPTYRERALAHVERAEKLDRAGRRNVSQRVQLLLADHDVDAARELAEQHAVHLELLESLAHAVAATHPAAAAGFLRRFVTARLPGLDASRYEHAARQIARVRDWLPGAETNAWIGELRTRYKARRKLRALLDALLEP